MTPTNEPFGVWLPDGLYRVTTRTFVAGFVVVNARVVLVAPILRRRLWYWLDRAERIGD